MKIDCRKGGYALLLTLGMSIGCSEETGSTTPTLHTMHIGIDAYVIEPLLGAVNDAEALSALSKDLGAQTNLLLLDSQVTRQAIFDGWAHLLRASRPGDVLLVTYAGHGSYISAEGKSDEPDGRDEILVLPGVDRGGKDQIIVDDEIALMFAQATDRKVIWLADACHSGTSSRSAGSPELAFPMRSRTSGLDTVLPPLDDSDFETIVQPNVVSLAAVTDDMRVPEILHLGRHRGALSVAFERAVRGRADRTPMDGRLSFQELRDEIVAQVRILTNNGQATQLQAGVKEDLPLLRSLDLREEPLSKTRVFLVNADRMSVTDRTALTLAPDHRSADFMWDVAQGDIHRLTEGVAKRVATGVSETGGMLGEILRWEVLQAMQQLPRDSAPLLQVTVIPTREDSYSLKCLDAGGECHRGTPLRIEARLVEGADRPDLTLVTLSAQGTVYWYGIGGHRSAINADVYVDAPYGVEHVIAIATTEPISLASTTSGPAAVLNGSQGMAALETLKRLAENGNARIATSSLYTSAQ